VVAPPPAPPPAPAPPPPPESDGPRERSALATVRDNLEAIAFALVLALLLRHFCIEVFKIPTGSMWPTLYGDDASTRPATVGDRILVDKLAYLFHGPERWDVVVFRYPLDRSRNFIKRVTGLPGEDLRILRGDVWTRRHGTGEYHVARKPRSVREQLYTQVYPPAEDSERQQVSWYWRDDASRGPSFRVESWNEFVFDGAIPGPGMPPLSASLRYVSPITDLMRWERVQTSPPLGPREQNGTPVADVRVTCEVLAKAAGAFEISWRSGDGRLALLRLASDGVTPSSQAAASGTRTTAISARLVPGKRVRLELESVDGDVHAWVDGTEVATIADEMPIEEVEKVILGEQDLRLRASGGAMTVTDVHVDHDLYYTGPREDGPGLQEPIEVPDDAWFMMGDNTRHSSDSRKWTANGMRMKDGREVWWDSQTHLDVSHEDGAQVKRVTDVEGVERTWRSDEEDPSTTLPSRRVPFVTRDLIVGRAFFALVFWPLDGSFLSRWRLIH
jgi:signal peptidase I